MALLSLAGQVESLLEANRALTERVERLEERLGRSSRNSSLAPSSDPLGVLGQPPSRGAAGGRAGNPGIRGRRGCWPPGSGRTSWSSTGRSVASPAAIPSPTLRARSGSLSVIRSASPCSVGVVNCGVCAGRLFGGAFSLAVPCRLLLAGLAILGATLLAPAALARPAAGLTAVAAENALPGTTSWLAPLSQEREIEGYTSEISVAPGDTLHLHVSTSPDAHYRAVVYRLGWYGGAGARLLTCIPGCSADESGAAQPVPPPDPVSGNVRAGWPVTDALAIPTTWMSGYYVVQLVLTSGPGAGTARLVPFVLRDPPGRRSAILVQVPVNTWQAYNAWGGKSLYNFNSSANVPAVKVSFDRPYNWRGSHSQTISDWELPLVRFLEREGYDVSYQADSDTDRDPDSLVEHRLIVVAGHGEYWTKGERDAFEAARNAGTNLAFMAANIAYWQVRYEDGGRTMVGYKSLADPIPDPALKTALFRELTPSLRECELLGIQHQGGFVNWPMSDYLVNRGALTNPWFAGTGFDASSRIVNAVSVEADTIPRSETRPWSCGHAVTVLFHREGGGEYLGDADAVSYIAASGARVFASGSHQFVWALDSFRVGQPIHDAPVDPRLQQFVRNMLTDLTRPTRVTVIATAKRGGIRLSFHGRREPGVELVVLRHPGPRSFQPTDPGTVRVCTASTISCLDRPPGGPPVYRYQVIARDNAGSSTPSGTGPIRIGRR